MNIFPVADGCLNSLENQSLILDGLMSWADCSTERGREQSGLL